MPIAWKRPLQSSALDITFAKACVLLATSVQTQTVRKQFVQTNALDITPAQANAKSVASAKTLLVPKEYVHTNAHITMCVKAYVNDVDYA